MSSHDEHRDSVATPRAPWAPPRMKRLAASEAEVNPVNGPEGELHS